MDRLVGYSHCPRTDRNLLISIESRKKTKMRPEGFQGAVQSLRFNFCAGEHSQARWSSVDDMVIPFCVSVTSQAFMHFPVNDMKTASLFLY